MVITYVVFLTISHRCLYTPCIYIGKDIGDFVN